MSISIVECDVVRAGNEVDRRRILGAEQTNGRDLDPPPVVGWSFMQARPASHQLLAHPGRAGVLPRVVVEMELEL